MQDKPEVYPPLEVTLACEPIFNGLETLVKLEKFKQYLAKELHKEYQLGLQEDDNWHINAKASCRCEHCRTLNQFLSSRSEQEKIWPLNADCRRHVTHTVNDLRIPVQHRTVEQGRPYRLILKKSNKLHELAKSRFDNLTKALNIVAVCDEEDLS